MRYNQLVFLLFMISVFSFAEGQEKNSSFLLGLRPQYGFVVKHSGKLEGLTKTFPWGIEVDAAWQLMSEKSWQYCFCYPRTGITFQYTNFANPQVLGSAFSLYPYVEPVMGSHRRLHTSIRFGAGPVYLNHVYDSVENPDNLFYSSAISFIVHAGINLNYVVNEKIKLKLTASFNHISNGGIKNPNLGINFPVAAIGLDYNFNPLPYVQRSKDKNTRLVNYRMRFDVGAFATGKTAVKGHERYPVAGVFTSFSYVFARQNAVSLATEFTLDYADRKEIIKNNLVIDGCYTDHKYFALMVGHELILGRFIFYQQLGVYLYSPYQRKDPVYQRYGLTYYLTKKVFTGINIKAHRQVADFLDFRAGLSF
ncbi:MAG: acyloxyacyl hydrolase [Bacteroidales bacterium]|nr:acyloxyacyl hydrolase [Bacteroidales bacterium]